MKKYLLASLLLPAFYGQAEQNIALPGDTALHRAVRKEYFDLAKKDLKDSPNLNTQNILGHTPLHEAILHNKPYAAKKLLEASADPNIQDLQGNTPLQFSTNSADLVSLLISYKADPSIGNITQELPIHQAAGHSFASVMELEQAGSSLTAQTKFGKQPIHYAAEAAQTAIIDYLLRRGADINAADNFRITPLLSASEPSVIEYLTQQGAEVTAKNEFGTTLLHNLVHLPYSEELLKQVAQEKSLINAQDITGNTPLMSAVLAGNKDAVSLLLEYEADSTIKDQQDKTAQEYAEEIIKHLAEQQEPYKEILKILKTQSHPSQTPTTG